MTDLSTTIDPKSDQLNADDLIVGPRTIRITAVSANPGSAEQPISINFDGDNKKPYKPCKSMRRVLVQVWGKDGNAYTGRSMTLYRDKKVQFGGLDVGGIRISHMSHIDKDITMALTATRASRKLYTVHPLPSEVRIERKRTMADWLSDLENELNSASSIEEIETRVVGDDVQKIMASDKQLSIERVSTIIEAARGRFMKVDNQTVESNPETGEIIDDFPGVVTRDNEAA